MPGTIGGLTFGLLAFAYAVVWIAVVLYVLYLGTKFVRAVERIATAMERGEDVRRASL
jgi:CcmD family protein